MKFNDSFSAKVQTLSISQDLGFGKYFTIGAATTLVRTFPSVDSTNVNVWQLRAAILSKKGLNIMLSSQFSQYTNGAFRKGAAISAGIPIAKRYKLTAKASFDHYYRLWSAAADNDEKALSGLLRLEIRI